jgi:hypothetical protein
MKYLLLTIVIFITITILTCTSPPLPDTKVQAEPWLVDAGNTTQIHEEIDEEPPWDAGAKEQDINETISREQMVNEIIATWTMFLDDARCGPNDSRWKMLPVYAEELADIIIMYQNQPTDIGGQLPKERAIHILMAVNVTKESSIYPHIVGSEPRNEVGLMQTHGVALAGYNPAIVQRNSRLGLLLGVRWYASRIDKCKVHRIPGDNKAWRLEDMIGPQTIYQAGSKAQRKDGTCQSYKEARERVDLTKLYLTRIIAANNG